MADASKVEDRGANSEPCFWFDLKTGRCQHYEFRPNICRMHYCDDLCRPEAVNDERDEAEADVAG